MIDNGIKFFRVYCILLLGVIFLFPLTQVSAEVVWVEDWENGSSDWIFHSYNYSDVTGSWSFQPDAIATPSVANGVFQTNSPSDFFGDYWSGAIRNSTTAYGSWSFDVIIGSGVAHESYLIFFFAVAGMPDDLTGLSLGDNNITGYFLVIQSGDKGAFGNPLIQLATLNYVLADYHPATPIEGTLHFHITRNTTGYFEVFFDPTNDSSPPILTGTNTTFTTCSKFAFGSWVGDSQIDNFFVWDEVVPPLTDLPTTTTTTPITTTTDNPESTTTTTAAGGPGFELQVLVLGLSALFLYLRKRRP